MADEDLSDGPHGAEYAQVRLSTMDWGPHRQLDSSEWLTTWPVDLEADLENESTLEVAAARAADEAQGFGVRIEKCGDREIKVDVLTTEWALSDQYFALTYAMFRIVDATVGRIRTINGMPRDACVPFLGERRS